MGGDILWAGGLSLAALLFWGLLLAMIATFLPRFLTAWESRAEARPPELEETRPGPPPRPLEEPAPAPVVREALPSRRQAEAEEAAVAAAITLALALYQEETARVPEFFPAPGPGSPWALSGRWQTMQARLGFSKR
jgi:hypothetical protein